MGFLKGYWLFFIFVLVNFTVPAQEQSEQYESLKIIIELSHRLSNDYQSGCLKTIPVIAFGGRPGAGKSYISNLICDFLRSEGVRAIVFRQDHFNKDQQERQKYDTDWDYRHLDFESMHRVLQQIARGEQFVSKPYMDQMTKERGVEIWNTHNIHLIILDGSYAVSSKPPIDFLQYVNVGVYIEADEQNARKWKWERELLRKNPRTPEEFESHMVDIDNDYNQNIGPSKHNAAYVIYKDSYHRYSVTTQ